MTGISISEEGCNYTKAKPTFGGQCPKCKNPLRMLFARTTEQNYQKADIFICFEDRVVKFKKPVFPISDIQHKIIDTYQTIQLNDHQMLQLKSMVSLHLIKIKTLDTEAKTIAEDNILTNFFLMDLVTNGIHLCTNCLQEIYSSAIKKLQETTIITFYPIKPNKAKTCLSCMTKNKINLASGIIRLRKVIIS